MSVHHHLSCSVHRVGTNFEAAVGQKIFGGLTDEQRRCIEKFEDDHPMRALLELEPGAELPVHVVKLGKMNKEQAMDVARGWTHVMSTRIV